MASLDDNINQPLSGQEFAMIMHGLRGMGSNWTVIQVLATKLSAKIRESSVQISGNQFATILNGFQTFGGGIPLPISAVFKTTTSNLGFGIMTNTRRRYRLPSQVITLLHAICGKLEVRSEPLTGPMVATALYGLQVNSFRPAN
jgi:hypothetical protein